MQLLICTDFNILIHSAGRNRLKRMCKALSIQGIESIMVGAGKVELQQDPWQFLEISEGRCITYNPNRINLLRHSRAMKIGAQAGRFYADCLKEIILQTMCSGVIMYTKQAQVAKPIIDICRQAQVFVVADVVEYHSLTFHHIMNGVNWQQYVFCHWYLPRLDGIVGISKSWCEWADKRRIPNVCIPSFAEDSRRWGLKNKALDSKSSFIMTFIGHFLARELLPTIFQAIRLCYQRGVHVSLNVLGQMVSYREQPILKMVRQDPLLQKCINLMGYVNNEERDRLLAESDAFVLLRSDNRETDRLFPTRLTEYLLSGNPVILSKAGSFQDFFEHRKDIWFVPPGDCPEKVSEAIIHFNNNPEERLAIGAEGRKTALREFSCEVLGKRLADFLKGINTSRVTLKDE